MKRVIIIIVATFISLNINAQTNPIIDTLFKNSYHIFELQRLPNGMYRDSKVLNGSDFHPISIANVGIGLISLCIADSMNWIGDAEAQALQTLKSVTGHTPGFSPDRTPNGYFRHFLDVNTGARAWSSEYSTIDTGILTCAALFCKKYFQSDSISHYADELWNSIDFQAAIRNTTTGKIFLRIRADGTGRPGALTATYNEYMIVAWLAKNSSNDPAAKGNVFWTNFYSSVSNLNTLNYNGIDVLTDGGLFLSSFIHQFNYNLCNHYTTASDYDVAFSNAQQADRDWWTTAGTDPYEWGCGAGSGPGGYYVDKINNNSDTIVSPHIIAGFLPTNPNGKNDLIDMWNSGKGKYSVGTETEQFLWRYSPKTPSWTPNEIQGIDYSVMLFGLASLPEYLGPNFFSTYNDFFPTFLPIELLSFNAKAVEQQTILLEWETASEIDNMGFAIERSLNGTDFQQIAWIDGLNQAAKYTFTDRNIEVGVPYYYRLKQMDFDGTISYSSVRTASIQEAIVKMDVFPNPINHYLNIESKDLIGEVIQIFNVNGQLVQEFQHEATVSNIPITDLVNGSYFIKTRNKIKKIIVLK